MCVPSVHSTALRLFCAVCSPRTTPPRARAVRRATLCRPHTHWHSMCATVTCSDARVCRVQRGGVCKHTHSVITPHMNMSYRMGHTHANNNTQAQRASSRRSSHTPRPQPAGVRGLSLPDQSPRQRAAPPPHGAKRGGKHGSSSHVWNTHGNGARLDRVATREVQHNMGPLQPRHW